MERPQFPAPREADPTYQEAKALIAGHPWKSSQPELTDHYFAQIASAFAPKREAVVERFLIDGEGGK